MKRQSSHLDSPPDDLPDGTVRIDRLPDGRWQGYAWCPCQCGKVLWVEHTESRRRLARLYVELASSGQLCGVCTLAAHRSIDACPDGGCSREFDHSGRCLPIWMTPEFHAAVAQLWAAR